jgi:hypothetical protein
MHLKLPDNYGKESHIKMVNICFIVIKIGNDKESDIV